jgi:hypothetical protein
LGGARVARAQHDEYASTALRGIDDGSECDRVISGHDLIDSSDHRS